MKPDAAYVVGLLLNPDDPDPRLYTVWYEYDDGESRVACHDGRIQWAFSAGAVDRLHDDKYDLTLDRDRNTDGDAVCDVATVLYAIQHGDDDNNVEVLDSVNLLDDFLITIENRLSADLRRLLARVVVGLTEGNPLSEVVPAADREATIEAVFASLGRVLALSDFVEPGPSATPTGGEGVG